MCSMNGSQSAPSAVTMNGDATFREGFGPLLADATRVPWNDPGALEAVLAAGDVAAFFVEPVQGKGVNLPGAGYLREAARLCRKYGALFVADEVQTGLGRCGTFLAVEQDNVDPDLVLVATRECPRARALDVALELRQLLSRAGLLP